MFETDRNELYPRLTRPDDEDAIFQEELTSNRKDWNILNEGWEGKLFVYKSSVIKTFTPGRSPFRNCAPGMVDKWPTEIAASLRFAGTEQKTDLDHDENLTRLTGFLPIRAYFKASPTPTSAPEWHLVTPLLRSGNLKDLAKRLSSRSAEGRSARELDATYRPAFEHLLYALQRLHDARYCHDDIKPENVFVQNENNWLLGDLGNLRHVSHPYHSSRLWLDNKQLPDCRSNDVMRILKSYLQFIKTASRQPEQFDIDFLQGKEPLSRLFWMAANDAPKINTTRLADFSATEYPQRAAVLQVNEGPFEFTRAISDLLTQPSKLSKAVNGALETRMGEKLARWWAMAGIFGIQDRETCGF
ncbi:hypothetical protein ACEQ8H_003009 [Pleosporales sp. CAS-2024a]